MEFIYLFIFIYLCLRLFSVKSFFGGEELFEWCSQESPLMESWKLGFSPLSGRGVEWPIRLIWSNWRGLLDKTEEKLGKKERGQGLGWTNVTKMLSFDLGLFMSRPVGGHACILYCSQFGERIWTLFANMTEKKVQGSHAGTYGWKKRRFFSHGLYRFRVVSYMRMDFIQDKNDLLMLIEEDCWLWPLYCPIAFCGL